CALTDPRRARLCPISFFHEPADGSIHFIHPATQGFVQGLSYPIKNLVDDVSVLAEKLPAGISGDGAPSRRRACEIARSRECAQSQHPAGGPSPSSCNALSCSLWLVLQRPRALVGIDQNA